jgi:GNAT superfamily N-acetyltransferase
MPGLLSLNDWVTKQNLWSKDSMDYIRLSSDNMSEIMLLQTRYKLEIGEDKPTDENMRSFFKAIKQEQILFFGCFDAEKLVACCSVSPTYSTFNYCRGGVFEDFYIIPEYRHKGIARHLVQYAYQESGVSSLIVGCANCDIKMYNALGFRIPLGNMLAFEG